MRLHPKNNAEHDGTAAGGGPVLHPDKPPHIPTDITPQACGSNSPAGRHPAQDPGKSRARVVCPADISGSCRAANGGRGIPSSIRTSGLKRRYFTCLFGGVFLGVGIPYFLCRGAGMSDQREQKSHAVRRVRLDVKTSSPGLGVSPASVSG